MTKSMTFNPILKENKIEFEVWGRRALFTDPVSKIGGEKSTYHIPTYEAMRGLAGRIIWKPTFRYVIDKIRVMKLIQTKTELKILRELTSPKTQRAYYTYLTNVAYQVQAHIEWDETQINLVHDRIGGKHLAMIYRHLNKERLPRCLGLGECHADIEPRKFGEGVSDYDNINEMQFGLMFHSFQYPNDIGENKQFSCHWKPKMSKEIIDGKEVGGIIKFPPNSAFPNYDKGLIRKFVKNKNIQIFDDKRCP